MKINSIPTKYKRGFIIGSIVLIGSVLFALFSGTQGFSAGNAIIQFRLPRIVAAIMVGASLSGVGLAMQAILKNPLADPYILGISGGSALFGTFSLLLPIGTIQFLVFEIDPVFFFSFAGGLITTILISKLFLKKTTPVNPYSLLLAGFAFNAAAGAIIMFIKTLIVSERTQEVIFWLIGNFSEVRISWGYLLFYLPFFIAASAIIYINSNKLNALTLGEKNAKSLGINPDKLSFIIFVSSAMVVAISVALVGMIGFIGVVIPQGIRIYFGSDLRYVFPLTLIFGAASLVLADAFSRLLFIIIGSEIPVGIISSIIGAPIFIILLLKEA